jgi:phosphoribosyl 1,2-cyclic phosphodiesterase
MFNITSHSEYLCILDFKFTAFQFKKDEVDNRGHGVYKSTSYVTGQNKVVYDVPHIEVYLGYMK